MPLDRRDIERSLKRKGFSEEEDRDHRFYFFQHNGQKTAQWTKVSTGSKYRTIGDKLIAKMCRQVNLSKSEFHDLISCTLSGARYLALLQEKGLVPASKESDEE